MEEIKIPLVKLRANYIGPRNQERQDKGYSKTSWYNILIKQEGEKMLVKRADEKVKGESKLEYNNFSEFIKEWTTFK